jgi:hypothetical protein
MPPPLIICRKAEASPHPNTTTALFITSQPVLSTLPHAYSYRFTVTSPTYPHIDANGSENSMQSEACMRGDCLLLPKVILNIRAKALLIMPSLAAA